MVLKVNSTTSVYGFFGWNPFESHFTNMKVVAGYKEDPILQFIYEADIGINNYFNNNVNGNGGGENGGFSGFFDTFDHMQRRIRWNFDSLKVSGQTSSSSSNGGSGQSGQSLGFWTDFGPFGDHGYILPFIDLSAFVSQPSKERIFMPPPKKTLFTRYFSATTQNGGGAGSGDLRRVSSKS